jgi:hypothetical protein
MISFLLAKKNTQDDLIPNVVLPFWLQISNSLALELFGHCTASLSYSLLFHHILLLEQLFISLKLN